VVPGAVPRRAAGGALRRALFLTAALLLATAAAFSIVPLGRSSQETPALVNGRAANGIHGAGPLRAGAAAVLIQLGARPVVAGYGGHRRAQSAEPVFARALALEAGGARAYLGVIDTLLIPGDLEEEVLRRARLGPQTCLLLAATHTHSGPGGAWDNAIAGWAGAGRFDREQRDAIAQAAADALKQAAAALAPAELLVAREEWPQGPAQARSEGPIDDELVALQLRRADKAEVATLVDYAMHPTSAPHDRISPDWPGGVPGLVVQGAVGNTTWARDRPLAPAVVAESRRILITAAPEVAPSLSCETRIVALPAPQAGLRVPWPARRAFANAFALGMDRFAVQTRLRIGSLSLVGVPGEPVGELGLAARPAVLVGLADGYVGYVETPERWQAGLGESSKTYFGPTLAHALGLWPR
jgi:hypothetical protein